MEELLAGHDESVDHKAEGNDEQGEKSVVPAGTEMGKGNCVSDELQIQHG